MTARPAARVAAPILAAALAAVGCAAKKPVMVDAGPGYAATGSVAFGTFARRGEADLEPQAPLASLDFVGDTLLGKTETNAVYALSGGLDIRYVQQVAEPGILIRKPLPFAGEVIFPTPVDLKFVNARGETTKTVRLPNPITSDLSVDPRNLLLAGTAAPTGGRVSIIDPQNMKKPVTEETLIGPVLSAPVGFQGVVYAANQAGKVFAIGDERRASWPIADGAFITNRMVTANLVVDDYGVYVAGVDTKLYALDRTSGRIKWRYMAETPLVETPLVTADRVYQVVPDAGLVALAKTLPEGMDVPYRQALWTAPGVTRALGADDKYVYAVVGKGTIAALDLATGTSRFTVSGDFDFYAIGPDKTVYAATKAGRVFGFSRAPYTGEGDVAAAR